MMKFSEIIKKLRDEKGYSQEVLAEELGVSKSTIAMWETDKRLPGKKELYEQLADFFNVDIDFLYGRSGTRKKYHIDEHGNEYINSNIVRGTGEYYYNKETREIAQEIFENKDMRILFDVARKTKPETLKTYAEFLRNLQKEENND